MKKLVLSMGKVLSKTEQRVINGGGDDGGGGCGDRCGTNNDCWGNRICSLVNKDCNDRRVRRCRSGHND